MIPSQHIFDRIIKDQSSEPLMENNLRGVFVEYLIVDVLGQGWTVRKGSWDDWDIDGPEDLKVEVKSSAYLQSWCRNFCEKGEYRISRPEFGIAEKPFGSWGDNKGVPTRVADCYIFALHGVKEIESADQRVVEQWEFYVVPTSELPKGQKTIQLTSLRKLSGFVHASQLKEEIELKMNRYLEGQ